VNLAHIKFPWVLLKQLEDKLEENKAQAEKVYTAARKGSCKERFKQAMGRTNQSSTEDSHPSGGLQAPRTARIL
jgi:hypothetical protein